MTLDYTKFMNYQSAASKQLQYLDQLIADNLEPHQQYPQLFQNEDSLFAPDQVFDHHHDLTDPPPPSHNLQFMLGSEEEPQNIFANFLDVESLMKLQCSSKIKSSKSTKNIESSLECTFKPSISKKSSQIACHLKPSFERLTTAVRNSNTQYKIPYKPNTKQVQKKYSKQRIQRLSKPRILKTQPNQPPKMQTQKKPTMPRPSHYLDIAARNQLWQQQKQQKLQKLRKQQQQNKIKQENTTFVPKLTEYKGEKGVNLSNFGKEGIANYFQRLYLAKSKNMPISHAKEREKEMPISHAKEREKEMPISHAKEREKKMPISHAKEREKENSPINGRESMGVGYAGARGMRKQKDKEKYEKDNRKQKKIKYEEAVKELHRKLMSLKI